MKKETLQHIEYVNTNIEMHIKNINKRIPKAYKDELKKILNSCSIINDLIYKQEVD